MTTALLRADTILTLDAHDTRYAPGYLVLEGDRIREIGPQADLAKRQALAGRHFDVELTLKDRLLMPGLVNAHTHTPMVLFRGLAEPYSLFTFEGWYEGIRSWEAVLDPDMIPDAVAVSCAEMIRTGTTCFADQYFYMDRITPVVEQSGLRAALAYGIVEMGDADAREHELGAAAAFLESIQGHPRLKGWVGPHAFFVDNSPEAIQMELALADRFETGLHFHLATSGEEERYCREHFGCSAVQQMERLGILERRLLAAHSITLPPEDFPTLARHPFTAVIAASACMRSGAEIAALATMRDAGINIALGTDNVANNNSYDMFNEMQTTAKLMSLREKRPAAVPAAEILRMATLGGARALGLEDEIGSLEVGKKADLITLDLSEIGWAPDGAQSLDTALVYSVSGMHVRDVMVDGAWLMRDGARDGAWLTLDYAGSRARLNAALVELKARRG
ncbi:MAG: amidohydrolase [Anaerolineae bacterium]|nr:amidohydrolase [Anaerolineae bacterium]